MRKILLFVCLTVALNCMGKTTYIPIYHNRLIVIEDGEIDSLTNSERVLSMSSKDGLVIISLEQQIVSEDLIKAIKRAKRAETWGMIGVGLSAVSAGLAQGSMNSGNNHNSMSNYYNARKNMEEASSAVDEASAKAEELKTLFINIVVKNNSSKEMLVSDMDRGLQWFVLPHNERAIPFAGEGERFFRVSSCNPLDADVKYIYATSYNSLGK